MRNMRLEAGAQLLHAAGVEMLDVMIILLQPRSTFIRRLFTMQKCAMMPVDRVSFSGRPMVL